jgi:hypothetical protein
LLYNRFSLPSIHFRHRSQQYVFAPSIHKAIPLSFPFLPSTFNSPQLKFRLSEKKIKKKVKFCSQEKALTISGGKPFFAKTISVQKDTAILFAKKYCIAFSFHTVGALSFFLFFLFENFQRSITFKTRVMLNFKIRTFNPVQEPPENALFILNRGRNAGKPLHKPCPNCFIIYCSDPDELQTVYWTFYALWKNGFFHPHLCGSVIEMLRLSDLKTLFHNWIQPGIKKATQNPEMIDKIKSTWELEQKMKHQSELIKQLRDSLVRKYYFSI